MQSQASLFLDLFIFVFAFSTPDDIPDLPPVLVSKRLGPLAVLLAELAVWTGNPVIRGQEDFSLPAGLAKTTSCSACQIKSPASLEKCGYRLVFIWLRIVDFFVLLFNILCCSSCWFRPCDLTGCRAPWRRSPPRPWVSVFETCCLNPTGWMDWCLC